MLGKAVITDGEAVIPLNTGTIYNSVTLTITSHGYRPLIEEIEIIKSPYEIYTGDPVLASELKLNNGQMVWSTNFSGTSQGVVYLYNGMARRQSASPIRS